MKRNLFFFSRIGHFKQKSYNFGALNIFEKNQTKINIQQMALNAIINKLMRSQNKP